MTISSKQVMQQSEFSTFFRQRDCLGLIAIDRLAMRYGFQNMYTFLHLTFQEFLGAYYISSLAREDQKDLIKRYGKAEHMKQVWIFYCGLVKFTDEHEQERFKVLVSENRFETLFKVQCSFESQQPCTCNYVVQNNSLNFSQSFLSPTNFTAIAYVISHSEQNPVMKLVLHKCLFQQQGIAALKKTIGENASQITYLSFHGSSEQLQALNHLIDLLSSSLEYLDISDTDFGTTDINAVIKDLNLPNLHTLQIGSRGDELPRRLTDGFVSNCSNLQHILI